MAGMIRFLSRAQWSTIRSLITSDPGMGSMRRIEDPSLEDTMLSTDPSR